MIFEYVHEHVWWLTGGVVHGQRVSECTRCGDRAWGAGTPGYNPQPGNLPG